MDSQPDQEDYFNTSKKQRWGLSFHYLAVINGRMLSGFDVLSKLSHFSPLFRRFTRANLEELLTKEYPDSNLLFVILNDPRNTADTNATLEQYYTFISVAYWKQMDESLPGLFKDPRDADDQAYAEVHMFVPRTRLAWIAVGGGGGGSSNLFLGGVPGQNATVTLDGSAPTPGVVHWVAGRKGGSERWTLINQNWTSQLAPTTQSSLADILQTAPPSDTSEGEDFRLPNLGGMSTSDIQRISPH
jgi:hypothetical protein